MDCHEILKILRQHKQELKQKFGVKRLGVFGSYVRDEQAEDSDVDIVVEFEKGRKTFDNFIDLVFFLEELLGKKVDLVTSESVSPSIRPYIAEEVIYEIL